MTPDELAAIRERDAAWGKRGTRVYAADAIKIASDRRALLAHIDALTEADWHEVMLDALRGSDGGNNPFYSDDPDTVALADDLRLAVLAILRGEG